MAHVTLDTALTCDEPYDVEEYCSNCDNYIAIRIDRSLPHLETICPVCKATLMICSMCNDNSCDWSPANGCHMKARRNKYVD